MKKIVLVLCILLLAGGTAFSFDLTTFPSPIQQGSLLISPTFNLGSYYYASAFALGITASVEYCLPISFALAVGGEAGVGFLVGYSESYLCIPIFARVSWHPNFEVNNLDTYLVLKLGYNISLTQYYGGGFSFGFAAGARWFFTPVIGVFGELGWDRYGLKYDYDWYYNYTTYIYTWLHLGVTFKVM